MIENVKNLRSELDTKAFRDLTNRHLLKQARVEIHKTKSDQTIATGIALACAGVRKAKTLHFDVIGSIPRIHRRCTAWAFNPIRRVKGAAGELAFVGRPAPQG